MKKLTQIEAQNRIGSVGLKLIGNYINKKAKHNFTCFCGNIFTSCFESVACGLTKSCGCLNGGGRPKDISGKKFNKLTAIEFTNSRIGGSVVWICKCDCGKTCKVPLNRIINNNTKSCGCLDVEIAINRLLQLHPFQKGINHPSYLGDSIDRTKRGILESEMWTKEIYKKYNYTCNICSKTNCKICAHHLDAWNKYIEKRFDVNNGVCLCKSCHVEFHRTYGYGDNTKEQYIQFKESKKLLVLF